MGWGGSTHAFTSARRPHHLLTRREASCEIHTRCIVRDHTHPNITCSSPPALGKESGQSSSDHSFTDSHRSARTKTEFVVNIKLLMTSFCSWESVESSNKDQDITDWLCFSLFPVSVCAANPRDSSQSSISQIWITQSCFNRVKVFM